ncbi:MAG: CDP-alcohol phosphatidyltransferase family protein [Candidatus Aenigmarchaeota archaeon]|nr:CDP-alcohol phosphatidyltransferase family protein [Candidatus Aenigmarchaeota archaeon]
MLAGKRDKFAFLEKALGPAFSFLPANAWTLIAVLFSAGTAYFLATQQFLYAGAALSVTGLLDMVDGAVARATKKAGPKGAYLDTIADRYAEGIIIFGLLLSGLPSIALPAYYWIFIYFFGGSLTTYAKAAFKEKTGKDLGGGLVERAERLVLLAIGVFMAAINPDYLMYIIMLLAVLTNLTAVQRIMAGLKNV